MGVVVNSCYIMEGANPEAGVEYRSADFFREVSSDWAYNFGQVTIRPAQFVSKIGVHRKKSEKQCVDIVTTRPAAW